MYPSPWYVTSDGWKMFAGFDLRPFEGLLHVFSSFVFFWVQLFEGKSHQNDSEHPKYGYGTLERVR